ncbi:hypothetical protein D3C81_2236180 [compost metagenome]
MKQQHAKALFELAHLVGHGWLSEKQLLRRAREATVLSDRMKRLELCLRHRHTASTYKLSLCVKYDKSIFVISQ